MTRYYCDYCDVYLTHDAPRVRRDHNAGWKHAAQVKAHFLSLNQDKMARQIGEIVKDYEARGEMVPVPAPQMLRAPMSAGLAGAPMRPPLMRPPPPGMPMMPPMGMPMMYPPPPPGGMMPPRPPMPGQYYGGAYPPPGAPPGYQMPQGPPPPGYPPHPHHQPRPNY